MSQQEPGPWELQRRLDQIDRNQQAGFDRIDARLDRLVTNDAFAAEQRRTDEKFKDLAEDLAEERRLRAVSIQEEKAHREQALKDEKIAREQGDARQQTALDKLIANQKWVLIAIFLPIGLFLANLFFSQNR